MREWAPRSKIKSDDSRKVPPSRAANDAARITVQRKLAVGAVDDPQEREADRVADAVMSTLIQRRPDDDERIAGPQSESRIRRATSRLVPPTLVERAFARDGTAHRIRRAAGPAAGSIDDEIDLDGEDEAVEQEAEQVSQEGGGAPGGPTKSTTSEESETGESSDEESVQRAVSADAGSSAVGHGPAGGEVDPGVARSIDRARGGGRPLDGAVRSKMEGAFGADFADVRVHAGSSSDALNRSLNARAFTVGSDVFFAKDQFSPASGGGQRLLAHELAHVVQQGGGSAGTAHRKTVIRRKFGPAVVASNAHLRDANDWSTFKGPKIAKDSQVLVDTAPGAAKVQARKLHKNVTWIPAVNVAPDHNGAPAADRKGYIRSSRVLPTGRTLERQYKRRIKAILKAAEQRHAGRMEDQLTKDAHIAFLMDKALRYDSWNGDGTSLDGFVSGFSLKEDKFTRITDGANYVADSLEHWRTWLHPTKPDLVTIDEVKLIESDLHERGLGVVKVKFGKPKGPRGHKFAAETAVTVMIKPEDKSLEQALLGDDPDSAANKINDIVDLTDPKEMLTTIKMCSDATYGSLVELVKATAAEDLPAGGARPVEKVFHEMLVFAFLAGIDDLHKENVFWDAQGRPFLIDADNVLSHNQMLNTDNGALTQGGFGGSYDDTEATKNKNDIAGGTNTVGSKILDAMLNDDTKKLQIIDALRDAITGKQGRVVPIKTSYWAQVLKYYSGDPAGMVRDLASRQSLVRDVSGFDAGVGPGLCGVAGLNPVDDFYDIEAEKKELKKDLDAGVIPFYEYDFSTGHVTHNGTKIYHGLTVDQAMEIMLNKFDPTKAARIKRDRAEKAARKKARAKARRKKKGSDEDLVT